MTTKEKKHVENTTDQTKGKKLVLFNDDVNSFEYVINTLIEVCGHDANQAETCTWIAHFKGKCAVKKGDEASLKKYYNEMTLRKLTVEIQ
jgi:ATP-dependent Clp protease adaptor protein ClpS